MYKIINSRFIKRAGLEHIGIPIRKLIKIKRKEGYINKIVKVDMDIDGYW